MSVSLLSTGEELLSRVSRQGENILKVVRTPSSGEKYLAVQSAQFQYFVTEWHGVVQDFYVGRVELQGDVILQGGPTIHVMSGNFEN